MPISYQKGLYFWHRYLEHYDPVRAIEKWNKGYPHDLATAAQIEAFLSDMVNRCEAGQRDNQALYCIVTGQETIDRPAPVELPPAPMAAKTEPPKKSLKEKFSRKPKG